MRPDVLTVAVLSLAGLGLAIMAGGQALISNETSLATPDYDGAMFQSFDENEPAFDTSGAVAQDKPLDPAAQTRGMAQAELQPPPGAAAPAVPPAEVGAPVQPSRPVATEEKTLYRPVATSAGIVEAMGYTIAIAGTIAVKPDEKCSFQGKSWPCGIRARSEFRAWLRDRAVTCKVPHEPSGRAVSTTCRIGKADAGAWLVKHGWARAEAAGPYAKAGDKARADKIGIFGRPSAVLLGPEQNIQPESLATP